MRRGSPADSFEIIAREPEPDPQEIFADDFESGDLSGWSAVGPTT